MVMLCCTAWYLLLYFSFKFSEGLGCILDLISNLAHIRDTPVLSTFIIIASGRAHSAGNRTTVCARVQQSRREEVEEVVFSYEEKKREEVD
jgi:hypothetical protein